MARKIKFDVARGLPLAIASAVDLPPGDVRIRGGAGSLAGPFLEIRGQRFALECTRSGDGAPVALAVHRAKKRQAGRTSGNLPMIVVAFMSRTGKSICADAGISWADLSGNCHIKVPGLYVHAEGYRSRFRHRVGRPANAFAAKSSRVSRHILSHPDQVFGQRELAREVNLDAALCHRVLKRLVADGFVLRDEKGAVRVADFNALLDAWAEAYEPPDAVTVTGTIPGMTDVSLLRHVSRTLAKVEVEHAVTGLAAARVFGIVDQFDVATVYVHAQTIEKARKALDIQPHADEGNVQLIGMSDEAVLWEVVKEGDIRCAHPLEIYLGLLREPGEPTSVAAALREKRLGGQSPEASKLSANRLSPRDEQWATQGKRHLKK